MVTYHNYTDGWFFVLPEQWQDNFTVRRTESYSGEKTVTFFAIDAMEEYIPVMRIHTLTGDNKAERASLPGRQLLMVRSGVYYCYELTTAYQDWEYKIDETEIAANFSNIRSEWNTGKT